MTAVDSPERSGLLPRARTIGHLGGVRYAIHPSTVLLAALLIWYFVVASGQSLPSAGLMARYIGGALVAVLFIASVAAHEAAHASVSRARGVAVSGVTVFLLGGITESPAPAARPRDEAAIVAAGPFTSVVLGATFGLATMLLEGRPMLALAAGHLGWMNLVMAGFNLLPAYPLDGGKLVRAAWWGVTGSRERATLGAARCGQMLGIALMAVGGMTLARTRSSAGLWQIAVGALLFRSAGGAAEPAQHDLELARRSVREVMTAAPVPLRPDQSVGEAAALVALHPGALHGVGAPLRGVVSAEALAAAPEQRLLQDVVLPLEGRTIDADRSLLEAAPVLREAPERMLLVTSGGRLVGLLTPRVMPPGTQHR